MGVLHGGQTCVKVLVDEEVFVVGRRSRVLMRRLFSSLRPVPHARKAVVDLRQRYLLLRFRRLFKRLLLSFQAILFRGLLDWLVFLDLDLVGIRVCHDDAWAARASWPRSRLL